MSQKNNALIAKTRAVYGKRLTPAQYDQLIACHTVHEIAMYLRENTGYHDILDNKNDAVYHRGKLEAYIKERLFTQYAQLCKHDLASDMQFFKAIVVKGEIDQLLHCIRLLSFGRPEEYLFVLPDFFNHHTGLDLYKLAQARTGRALLEVTIGSVYHSLLSPLLDNRENISYVAAENALYSYYYDYIHRMIERSTHGALHSQLKHIFGMRADLYNLSCIIRLKKYYNASPEYIRSMLLPCNGGAIKSAMEDLIAADSAERVLEFLQKSRYGRSLREEPTPYLENTLRQIEHDTCRRILHLTSHGTTALAAYMFLAEMETHNLINIIESIRYNLSPSEIYPLLVGMAQ